MTNYFKTAPIRKTLIYGMDDHLRNPPIKQTNEKFDSKIDLVDNY